MDKVHKVLINKVDGRFTINFLGAFPHNKFALRKGQRIYLNEMEWDFVKNNLSHIIGNQVTIEGEEEEVEEKKKEEGLSPEQYFEQHHSTARSQIKGLAKETIDEYIEYANENEINNKTVDQLIERANELDK